MTEEVPDLLNNTAVPITWRVVYLGASKEQQKEMQRLYEEDYKKGLFH